MSTAADARARPEDKEGHSFRFRNDTWGDVKEAFKSSTASDCTEWVKEAIEARLGYVRCDRGRCGQPVPVEWGDLTGHPFDWWIGEAVAEVRGQKCRAHRPVTIGRNRAEWAGAAAAEVFGSAAATVPVPDEPLPSPGSAVFREPGGTPVIAAAVPEVPASRSRKGRRP